MTTRRNALKLAAGSIVAAIGPGQRVAAQRATWALGTSLSDLEVLIACRDEIQRIDRLSGNVDSITLMLAAHNLDNEIMKRCPHDPTSYTTEYVDEISSRVTCPFCRATISSALLACFRAQEGRSA